MPLIHISQLVNTSEINTHIHTHTRTQTLKDIQMDFWIAWAAIYSDINAHSDEVIKLLQLNSKYSFYTILIVERIEKQNLIPWNEVYLEKCWSFV